MELISFIPESLFIVIVAVYVLGVFFKSVEYIKNTEIPMLLLFFAIIFSMLIEGFNAGAVMQGIVCYGLSTGIYSFKNEVKKQKEGRV